MVTRRRLMIPAGLLVLVSLSSCQDGNWGDPLHMRGGIPVTRSEARAGNTINPYQPTSIPVKEFPPKEDVAAEVIELPAEVPVTPMSKPAQKPVDLLDLVATKPAPAVSRPTTSQPSTARSEEPIVAPRSGGKEVYSASMLQVNDQYISIDEIVRSQAEKLKEIPKGLDEDRFRKRAADILSEETRRQVSECLVLTEANRRIEDEQKKRIEAEVDAALRQMVAEMGGGSKKKLEQVLIEQGTTLDTVLANHRRHITVGAYMHFKLEAAVRVNRPLLWDYYSKHKDQFTQEPKVRMQTITVPFREFLPTGEGAPSDAEVAAAKVKARERIAQAAAELKAGKKFADVATAYSKDSKASEGGLWPAMAAGSFRDKKVESAAFALAEGQVSEVIDGLSGLTIVKAAEVQPGRTKSFEEAQTEIERKMRDDQERTLTDQYFTKMLESSTVVQYSKFLDLAVDRAVERFFRNR